MSDLTQFTAPASFPAPVDLSLSHHGDWLGFACELDSNHNGAGGTDA